MLLLPGTGYTSPPNIVILEGGGGTGAVAAFGSTTLVPALLMATIRATQNNPRGLASILISDPGFGYFMAPSVIITGGGGAGAKASARLQKPLKETFARGNYGRHRQMGIPWVPPTVPGTYLISVEITDDDGDVTLFLPMLKSWFFLVRFLFLLKFLCFRIIQWNVLLPNRIFALLPSKRPRR